MARRVLTPEQRQARVEQRAALRGANAVKVNLVREWRKARRAAVKERAKARAQELRQQPRGEHRVPEHLLDLFPTIGKHAHGKRPGPAGQLLPINSTLGTFTHHRGELDGNHAERRAMGQRGKVRKLRVREMPGAEARRIERNRKAWSA